MFISFRRHYLTLELGRVLGFYAVEYKAQYVLDRAEIEPAHFSEIVNELGYYDLHRGTTPNVSFRHALQISLPRDAAATAHRWSNAAVIVAPYSERIRDSTDQTERDELVGALIDDVTTALGVP